MHVHPDGLAKFTFPSVRASKRKQGKAASARTASWEQEGGEITMKHQYIDMVKADWWACLCGNTPIQEGFYPCDSKGEAVEPTPLVWTGIPYVCDRCGRVIDSRNGKVIGVR